MIVRALNSNHDWTFGQGLNNYVSANFAVAQEINTRLNCQLGNCFFDLAAGINWFGLLGGKDMVTLNLNISSVILNTQNVTGINQLSINLSSSRILSVEYTVQTTYSQTNGSFVYDLGASV